MSGLVFGFCGYSNSGKTTLISKLARHLIAKGKKVAIIKHDPKDKAVFDTDGKDSQVFYATGADVAVLSPTRTTVFTHSSSDLVRAGLMLGGFDILLVESFRASRLPRILVSKDAIIHSEYERIALAIASPVPVACDKPCLDINDIASVADFVLKNAIKLSSLEA